MLTLLGDGKGNTVVCEVVKGARLMRRETGKGEEKEKEKEKEEGDED